MKRALVIVSFVAASLSLMLAVESRAQETTPERAKKPAAAGPKKNVPPEDDYPAGPDSERQPGVPVGKDFQFPFDESKIFPGTTRTISVHVPTQYNGDKPACVYVGLDGLGFAAPIVFDNLIHRGEMPVTIGIGVSPGQVESRSPPADPRFDRSNEFDGLDDDLARCILDEILPAVERRKTPDGLPILLSKDPNDRATGGGSTGGIGAFTLAWERPDAFRRVFSAIGTFVGMRGGDRYPVLVRKTEPKPIRVFLQDGSNDQWGGGPEVGDWWMSNQTLERSLAFAGYEVRHVWGHGVHSGRHPTAIFPEAMRWLWKDWPQPVKAGTSENKFLGQILLDGESWQPVAKGHPAVGLLAVDPQGSVIFRDSNGFNSSKVGTDGRSEETFAVGGPHDSFAFGRDGRAYLAEQREAKIVAFDTTRKAMTVAEGIRGTSLLVTSTDDIYVSEAPRSPDAPGKIWLVRKDGSKQVVDPSLAHAVTLAISPDGLWLMAAEPKTHVGYSYRIAADGTLELKQRFYWFHVPDWADDSGAGQWCADRDGRLYAATRMGVQVLDRNGRVRAILPVPGGQVTGITFGGENFDLLYVISADQLLRRKMKVPGVPAFAPPIKLPPWGAG